MKNIHMTSYIDFKELLKGYDLSKISGTGPNGVILARDVDAFVAGPKMSPMAAKLAAEYGVDVTKLDAKGRVMKADVLAAVGTKEEAAPAAAAAARSPATPSTSAYMSPSPAPTVQAVSRKFSACSMPTMCSPP